jgi:O-antigen/teichoic acid export membrane protein
MRRRFSGALTSLSRLDRKIARDFSSILALRAFERFSGLLVTVILFRSLEKEQLAQYGFVQTVVAVCAIFGIQEFQNTISQSVARGFPGTYRRCVPLALRWSTVGTLALLLLGVWYLVAGQKQLGFGFLMAAPVFPLIHAISQWKGVFQGEGNFRSFSAAEASNATARTLLILAALWLFPGSFLVPLLVFLAVPAMQNLRQTLVCFRRIPANAPVEDGAIAYGMRANQYSAVGVMVANLDRILIFTLLSPLLLAVYMVAEKFADLLHGMVQDLGAVLATRFSKIDRYSHRLDNVLKLASLAIGASVILFAVFALPSLTVLIFGDAYQDSVLYAQFLVASVAIGNIATLRFRFIRSKLDASSYRNVLFTASFGKMAASVVLIPWLGLAGAVTSVWLHRIVLAAITSHTIRTRYLKDAADRPGGPDASGP